MIPKPVAKMLLPVVLWSVSVLLSIPALGQSDLFPASYPIFRCEASVDNRLLLLHRIGNGGDRTAELTIFEIVEQGQRLRRLHHIPLLNPNAPLNTTVTKCGRFFVTMDEWEGSGNTPRTLVIYDLVRGEHTAMGLEDFLPEQLRKSLRRHAFIPGVQWRRPQFKSRVHLVDHDLLRVYSTAPEDCSGDANADSSTFHEENVPFLEIDLPGRSVRVLTPPRENWSERVSETKLYMPNVQWKWTMGESANPPADQVSALPQFVVGKFTEGQPDDDTQDTQLWAFELNPESGDYDRISMEQWQEVEPFLPKRTR